MMDTEFIKLDLLCGELQGEINHLYNKVVRLEEHNKMLEKECAALRDQLRYAEQAMYKGPTM